jgi:AcrR family transcriptional regulator
VAAATPLAPKQERSRETRRRLLDAAVDELVENGYAGLTTQAVARRAGVSRGAQQGHFPHRTTLVAEAIRHLAQRQIAELGSAIEAVPKGRARVRAALDVVFEQFSGSLFAVVVELSLAARADPELRTVIRWQERAISRSLVDLGPVIFGDARTAGKLAARWATALSAARGLALLKVLGHPVEAVDRQWVATRRDLLTMLALPRRAGGTRS